jgi:hypothetical protein
VNQVDHWVIEVASTKYRMKTLRPPAARTAALIRLTFGTISRAWGISTAAPGSMNPFWRSTMMCAVRAGSR